MITVNPLPTVSITGTYGPYCANSSAVTLVGSPAGGIFSGTGVSNGQFDPITAGAGTFTITYIYSDVNSCSNSVTTVITVLPLPAAVAGTDVSICIGSGTTLGAIAVGGSTYSWSSNPTGFTSTLANPTVSPTVTTTYTVIETASTGCTNSHSVTVTVNPILNASVSIVSNPSGSICAGTSVTFTATPVNGGTAPVYQWYKGVTPVGSNSSTYTYTVAKGDHIKVVMTSNATPCLTGSPATSNTITIADIIPPTISCPAPVSVYTNNGCTATNVNLGTPVTNDNCGVASVTNDAPAAFPVGTTTVTWVVTDNSGNTAACTQLVTVTGLTVSGTFKYYSSATPYPALNNVNVELWQGGVKMYPVSGTVTTNALGEYSFTGVCSGTYDVVASKSLSTYGAYNSTDALNVFNWTLNVQPIEKVKFYAGDVSLSNRLNSTDATRILQNFTAGGSLGWTGRGNWTFWNAGQLISTNPTSNGTLVYPQVVVQSGSVTQDFYGLATGDFDLSFVPGGAKSNHQAVTLNYEKVKEVYQGDKFEMPIFAGNRMGVGAVSLIMNFPSDKFEILGAYLGSDINSPVEYSVNNDVIRIGWYSTASPVSLNVNDRVLTLQLRAISSIGKDETVRFELSADPLNELADGNSTVIDGAILKMAEIGGNKTGNGQYALPADLTLINFPNPFRTSTTFAYSLPLDGKVTLEIYSIIGSKVMTLVDGETKTAGDYTLKVSKDGLKAGIYSAVIRVVTSKGELTRTIKVVCD